MRKIGNIIFGKDKSYCDLYNLCTTETMRPGIPSLIVGWDNVKQLYPSQNILDWQIDSNTYWTFGKREKRDKYDENLVKFDKIVQKNLSKKIKYDFIDILSCDICEKQLLNETLVNTTNKKTVFICNNIVYLYVEGDSRVSGFNLRDIEYSGKNKSAIFKIISSNPSITIISDIPTDIMSKFRDTKYILAYLYSE